MEVIKREEAFLLYRAECAECLSVVEGRFNEFNLELKEGFSWYTFECPICGQRRVARKDFWPNNDGLQKIRYKLNKDGEKVMV